MNWKHYLLLFITSLIVISILASFQDAPGYMDAEYYYSMGLRIANNIGLSEPFVWNYLTDVEALPHPGFAYWMPMPAFLTALGMWVTGMKSFLGGRILHILLAAMVPPLAMKVTQDITEDPAAAILAGLLAIFPVFYSPFLVTTDSFAVTMILGGAYLLLSRENRHFSRFLGLGAIAGMMHLSRADGLLWIIGGLYCAFRYPKNRSTAILSVLGGYLLVMVPWFARNLIVIGRLLPSGLSSTFWLKDYNELFTYSAADLTFQSWISQGIPTILRNYLASGLANIRTVILVEGQVILAPLLIIGAWKHRRDAGLQGVFLVWLSIFLVMSLVFPFAGLRGGFFHSGAAFQTMILALSASGLMRVIDWGVEKRDWVKGKAGVVFGSMLVVMVSVAALFVYSNRVIGGDLRQPIWNESYLEAKDIANYLEELGIEDSELVMINNPPGFYAASGRASIVIPDNGLEELFLAGKTFDANYLVLEVNHPQGLDGLYENPENYPQFELLGRINNAIIFSLPE